MSRIFRAIQYQYVTRIARIGTNGTNRNPRSPVEQRQYSCYSLSFVLFIFLFVVRRIELINDLSLFYHPQLFPGNLFNVALFIL